MYATQVQLTHWDLHYEQGWRNYLSLAICLRVDQPNRSDKMRARTHTSIGSATLIFYSRLTFTVKGFKTKL